MVTMIWTRMTATSVNGWPAIMSSGPGIARKNSETFARLKPTMTASSPERDIAVVCRRVIDREHLALRFTTYREGIDVRTLASRTIA